MENNSIAKLKEIFTRVVMETAKELEEDFRKSVESTGRQVDTLTLTAYTMQNLMAMSIFRTNLFKELNIDEK